ncbi:hypothetical protein SAMN04488004_13224 [Loktanella salsilacus]|uniref:Chemotaxis protein MotC n=1 Tax=Loktanella salsilacus TaxID=195913 RepID=A0A1I4J373_9RHOB|nr:hypothetical protein [Loktanella salsilacus]SFL60999.1 hypothetical protein SAMN04488004_13224 [Loktanella salsilacus]
MIGRHCSGLGAVAFGLVFLTAAPALCETNALLSGFTAVDQDAPQVSVVMVTGITRSDQLPPTLVQARKALSANVALRDSTLRDLADLMDGNAAFQYAKRLDFVAKPGLAAHAAHYYGIAAATGRGGAIYGFIKALDALDPATTTPGRLANLRNILVTYANAGSAPALEAVLRYHARNTPFTDMRAELDRILVETDGPAAHAVALQLASEILHSDSPTPAELQKARQYLLRAEDSDSLRTRLISQNLLPLVEARVVALRPDQSFALQVDTQGEITP